MVVVVPPVVLVVFPAVEVELELVEVDVEMEVEVETDVEVEIEVESVAAAAVGDAPAVIWARPTPAAAANARPTIATTMERRLNRLRRFGTVGSLRFAGELGLTPRSRRPCRKLALR